MAFYHTPFLSKTQSSNNIKIELLDTDKSKSINYRQVSKDINTIDKHLKHILDKYVTEVKRRKTKTKETPFGNQ